jgi:hypothetical protein
MAGTSYPGSSLGASFGNDLGADFIGRSPVNIGLPFAQWTKGDGGQPSLQDPYPLALTGGVATAVSGGGTKPAPTEHEGESEADLTSFAFDWFEHSHILPRVKIEFGNILTLVEDTFEIYSAFRFQQVTLASITNNADPGMDLPDISTPETVGPQGSLLRSTSTDNSAGTGLGTLVKTRLQALQDGLPNFDTNIIFNFSAPAEDVELLVSGSRIVFLPLEYEAPCTEVLAFLTDVITALDGREQRHAMRKNPRQIFKVTYRLTGNDKQRMKALLFDWTDNLFGFPLWHERLQLTAAVSAGATVYSVAGADDVDLRVGGLAVVFTDAATFDVISISAKTDTSITAADPSVNGYPAGTTIMPLRTAFIRGAPRGSRSINNLETFNLELEVTDNDTGQLTGSTTPGFWSTYNSRVLFDDCNVMNGSEMSEKFQRNVRVVDNETGIVTISSNWDRGKRVSNKGFKLHSRAELMEFRKLMLALRGRQKAFYLPTFDEDLTPKAALVAATDTLDIEAQEYVRFIDDRFPKNLFEISFTDGTSLVRTVTGSATVDSTTERLTLNTTWPANRTLDEIVRTQFYELVRFDTDNIQMVHERIGLTSVEAPVIRVFDDN